MGKKLFDLYFAVFDENGKTKNCGRQACIVLLEECFRVKGEPDSSLGDLRTGCLNSDAIRAFMLDFCPVFAFYMAYHKVFDKQGMFNPELLSKPEMMELLSALPNLYKSIFSNDL